MMHLKKKLEKKNFIISFLIVVLFVLGGIYVSDIFNRDQKVAQAATIVDETLQDVYYIGDSVSITDYYLAVYEGNHYQASNAILKYPDGTAKKSGTYTLTQTGKYTVLGYINVDDNTYEATKFFYVLNDANVQVDDIEPQIEVENGVENLNVIVDTPVRVLSASSADSDVVGTIKTEVYYAYGETFQSRIVVKDGEFTPKQKGEYTIVYSAIDTFGNIGYKHVVYNAIELSDVPFQISMTTLNSLTAGVKETLEWTVVNLLANPVEIEVIIVSDNFSYSLTNEKNWFVPQEAGMHTVKIMVKDPVYSYTQEYTVSCVATGIKVIEEYFNLPRYFLKDSVNDLGEIKAYEYAQSGKKEIKAKLLAKFDNGSWAEYNPREFIVGNYSKVQLRAECADDSSVFVVLGETNIIDVGNKNSISMEKYFIGDVVCAAERSSVRINANPKDGVAHSEFVNTINFASFSLYFKIPVELSYFEELKFTFIDRYDTTNTFDFTLCNSHGILYFVSEGHEEIEIGSIRNGSEFANFKIAYNSDEGKLLLYRLNKNIDWLYFEVPLTKMLCTFNMDFSGVYGASAIDIEQLNNQPFSLIKSDDFGADIYAEKARGVFAVGETISVSSAVAADVLGTVSQKDITVRVEAPDGSYPLSVDGKTLAQLIADREYKFVLTQDGVYTITYEATDSNGIKSKYPFYIYAVNYKEPTVIFNDGSGENTEVQVKTGSTHTIKSFKVSSATSTDLTTTVIVIKDNAIIARNVDSFVLDDNGTYTVYVYCSDENGNSAFNSYKVIAVKGE